MTYRRNMQSLIRVMEPETGIRTDHVVKRDNVTKMVKAFRNAGFNVVYVQHDYNEGAH